MRKCTQVWKIPVGEGLRWAGVSSIEGAWGGGLTGGLLVPVQHSVDLAPGSCQGRWEKPPRQTSMNQAHSLGLQSGWGLSYYFYSLTLTECLLWAGFCVKGFVCCYSNPMRWIPSLSGKEETEAQGRSIQYFGNGWAGAEMYVSPTPKPRTASSTSPLLSILDHRTVPLRCLAGRGQCAALAPERLLCPALVPAFCLQTPCRSGPGARCLALLTYDPPVLFSWLHHQKSIPLPSSSSSLGG